MFTYVLSRLETLSVSDIGLALAALSALYILQSLCVAVYNIYLHPLANYPGPKLRAAFYFPDVFSTLSGKEYLQVKKLHDRYGDVVRIRPNTLSYKSAQAWKDIYGLKPDRTDYSKDVEFQGHGVVSIITAIHQAEHARYRRILAPAFSDRALLDQEPMLTGYFDLMLSKLKQQVDGPTKGRVDMMAWCNFVTFDIIGQPFGCLEGGEYHAFIRNVFEATKAITTIRAAAFYPVLKVTSGLLLKFTSVVARRKAHAAFVQGRVDTRLARETDNKDLMAYMLDHNSQNKKQPLTMEELTGNARIMLLAGSETSATHLTGAFYLLLTHPEVLERLQSEVRRAFASAEDISVKSVMNEEVLPFMSAVIKETFRVYPSVPATFPRSTGPEGGMIDGQYVAPNTSIGVHQWSAYHSESNFAAPDEFHPERWLPDEAPEMFKNDKAAALQPFSYGPRVCLGKNLAYFEIRSVLARMLWHFDMELENESRDWINRCLEFALWDKPSLWVRLKHREKDRGA